MNQFPKPLLAFGSMSLFAGVVTMFFITPLITLLLVCLVSLFFGSIFVVRNWPRDRENFVDGQEVNDESRSET